MIIPELGGNDTLWWKLAVIISCGTLAGAIIPELVKVFTSTEFAHVKEVVTSSQEGGAIAQHSFRTGRRKLFRLLAGNQHRGPDGNRFLHQ